MESHTAKHVAEAGVGAVSELLRRGGRAMPHAHGAGKLGEMAVNGLAKVAPGAVAIVAAASATVAPAVAIVGAIGLVGYGGYKFVAWIRR
jgi:hypothetical protein